MPTQATTYTAAQIAAAARSLREAAGAEEERFPLTQALSMLGDEIRLLHDGGSDDTAIAAAFTRAGINATADQVQQARTTERSWS